MQYTLKTLAAAAAFAVAGMANAATTVPVGSGYNGLILQGGQGALSFSDSLISALNVAGVAVTAVDPATVEETYEFDPEFEEDVRVSSTASAPITSVTLEGAEVLSVATAGGALQTAPKLSGVSLGGTLAVANLNVDITNKRIYASITGNFTGAAEGKAGTAGGAITTIDNFYLWDFANISGPTTITGPGTYNNTITGLTITQSGFNHFVSALRLVSTGVSTLTTVTDYGTINSAITVTVPEPSTYAMAIAGLALVGFAARRRKA